VHKRFASRVEADSFVRRGPTPHAPAGHEEASQRRTTAVYTDGSCLANADVAARRPVAGWAFVAVENGAVVAERSGRVVTDPGEPSFRGAEHGSNNTGELTAVIEALLWARNRTPNVDELVVRYDSHYAANMADGSWTPTRNFALVESARSAHDLAARVMSIGFEHVRAHSGNVMNERVDRLARGAVTDAVPTSSREAYPAHHDVAGRRGGSGEV